MELLAFKDLVTLIQELPGLSSKQSQNLAHYLINNKIHSQKQLDQILQLLDKIQPCQICTIPSENILCPICQATGRKKQLLIVENIEQIYQFEKDQIFQGKYYVIPLLFNKKYEPKPFDFQFLKEYVHQFDEVILALSLVAEGILTSNLIIDQLRSTSNVPIKQLARGIPWGSKIDYLDPLTLADALKNRKEYD